MSYFGRAYSRESGRLRLTTQGRAMLMLGALMLLGVSLSIFNAPLASSAANSIDVLHSDQAVATDPEAAAWNKAKEVEVPLSAQQIYQPGGGSTRFVRVRAMEDGQKVAFKVVWSDDTRDDTMGSVPSDMAAIQLPVDPTNIPYQCMGQASSKVNIWQWRAAAERQGVENAGAMAMEGAGVRNLTSNGICRAVDTPGLLPSAHASHNGKEWHVVFYRNMGKGDVGAAPLLRGTNTVAAFAVWNGSRGEARGMKAVSTWNTVSFQSPEQNKAADLVTLGFVVVLSAGAVAYAMRRIAK